MWPAWWCPQALMQPEIFSFNSPTIPVRPVAAKRSEMRWASGIERALASEQ